MRLKYTLLLVACTAFIGINVQAQDISIGKDGVSVKGVDGTSVKVNADGSEVSAGKTKVKTGKVVKALAGDGTVTCTTDDVSVKDKGIKGDNGVVLTGACAITIADSVIDVSEVGLHLVGRGNIKATNVKIKAKTGVSLVGAGEMFLDGVTIDADEAIAHAGSGDLHIKNSTIKGKIIKTGVGEVHDLGGNTFEE